MRICCPHVGLSPESNSGGEVYERELLTHLVERGVEIDLILPGASLYPPGLPWTVHRTRLPRGFRWYVSNLVFPKYVKAVYDREPFDLLRAHSVRFTGPACLWARRRYQLPVPVVVHHHHLDPDMLNGLIEQRVLKAADLVVTDSQFSRRQLIDELGVQADKIEVVYCGVDARFKPKPPDHSLVERWGLIGKRVILCLGALKPRKNLLFLLDVFAHLVSHSSQEVCLVLAGSGPEEATLRDRARELGLAGRIVFAGFVAEANKPDYYNLADVFVQTSKLEGFGLVAAEAMACGVPVVVSKVGSLPEVVTDGVTGFLRDLSDTEGFSTAISRLLDNENLRRRMGAAATEHVQTRFNWDTTAREVHELYMDICKGTT